MKRPIAELQTMTVQGGAEAEWLRDEHEMWQILRHKPGYVTHRLYQGVPEPSRRLVYSEWESKKALDGARQLLQTTPLARRVRAAVAGPPERLVVEIIGPITSTKGLDLPETGVAAVTRVRPDTSSGMERLGKLGKVLASQPGYITHVLFQGFGDPALVGAFSHWQDAPSLKQAGVSMTAELLDESPYVHYQQLRT